MAWSGGGGASSVHVVWRIVREEQVRRLLVKRKVQRAQLVSSLLDNAYVSIYKISSLIFLDAATNDTALPRVDLIAFRYRAGDDRC